MHLLGVDREITIQLRVDERRVAVEQGELRQLEGTTEGRLQAGAFNRALAGEAAQAVLILGLRQLARRDAVAFDATDLGFDDGLHRLAVDLGLVNDEDSELARPAPERPTHSLLERRAFSGMNSRPSTNAETSVGIDERIVPSSVISSCIARR